MPRVSVIIPAYNASAYIADGLRSVRAQTYSDWEVVVVDDCSADGTAEVAEAFGPPIRVLRNERNLGPGGSRNRAIEAAGGELVALLDADDVWAPRYLESQIGRYDSATAAGRCVGIVSCDARISRPDRPSDRTILEHFREPLEPVTLDQILWGNYIFVSALVNRAAGDGVGWFSDLYGTQDHDLWLRILEQGWEAVLNREVLVSYRQPPGSISDDIGRMGADNVLTYRRALERGHLTAAQRRIATNRIRYSRAMEAVARARFVGDRALLLRRSATIARVVAENPRAWSQWLRILRGGAQA